MRFVDGLPPPITPPPESDAPGVVEPVAPVPPPRERTLPPIVTRRPEQDRPQPVAARRDERKGAAADRRKVTRRIRNEKVLVELRAKGDRRRRIQRSGDPRTAVDEEA